MDTLNAEHGVVEDRSFIRQRTTAIGLTLAVATLMACAMAVVLIGESEGFSGLFLCGFPLAWKAIQWPVALACILFGLALIYLVCAQPEARGWITPGAMVGCCYGSWPH
jgi:uncharacterized BrkB/YihY/UPF0761 family membrane protein